MAVADITVGAVSVFSEAIGEDSKEERNKLWRYIYGH